MRCTARDTLNQHSPQKPIFQTLPLGNKILKTVIKPHGTSCILVFNANGCNHLACKPSLNP